MAMVSLGSPNEPPKKKARSDIRKVKVLFKAPGRKSCELSIYAFWLSSFEYFEAKLDRWTTKHDEDDDDKREPIVLELQPECQPRQGAQIFKRRIAAAEVDEEAKWDAVQWWKSVNGDEESLFVAVYLFDLTLMQRYCKEVADTLHVFQIECPTWAGDLVKKYNLEVRCADSLPVSLDVAQPITGVSPDAFQVLCQRASQDFPSAQSVLDRSIAGCRESDEHLYVSALTVITLLPDNGIPRSWAAAHMKRLIARKPSLVNSFIATFFELQRRVASRGATLMDPFADTASEILHIFFVKSGRDALHISRHPEVLSAIESVAEIASADFESTLEASLHGLTSLFKSKISLPVFAIASSSAQRSLMLSLGGDVGKFFSGHAKLVHPDLRRLLLPHPRDLSSADMECLGSTDLPLLQLPLLRA